MISIDNLLKGILGLSVSVIAIKGLYSINRETRRLLRERKELEEADAVHVIEQYNLKTGEVKQRYIPVYHVQRATNII